MVKSDELIGTTAYMTVWTGYRKNRLCYKLVQLYLNGRGMWDNELGLYVSEQGQLADSFDQSNKTSCYIKFMAFPDWKRNS